MNYLLNWPGQHPQKVRASDDNTTGWKVPSKRSDVGWWIDYIAEAVVPWVLLSTRILSSQKISAARITISTCAPCSDSRAALSKALCPPPTTITRAPANMERWE